MVGKVLRYCLDVCFCSLVSLLWQMGLIFEGDTPIYFPMLSKNHFRVVLTENDMCICRPKIERVFHCADTEDTSELAGSHDFFFIFRYCSWFKF